MKAKIGALLLSTVLPGQFFSYGTACQEYGYACSLYPHNIIHPPYISGGGSPRIGQTYQTVINIYPSRCSTTSSVIILELIGLQRVNLPIPQEYSRVHSQCELYVWTLGYLTPRLQNPYWVVDHSIPNIPSLVGTSIYHQALFGFSDLHLNPTHFFFSNGLEARIQP